MGKWKMVKIEKREFGLGGWKDQGSGKKILTQRRPPPNSLRASSGRREAAEKRKDGAL
jgi:hypothetical protein